MKSNLIMIAVALLVLIALIFARRELARAVADQESPRPAAAAQ